MACVVVLFINAKGSPSDEGKAKAKTEVTNDAAKAPAMEGCGACPSMKAAPCSMPEQKTAEAAAKVCTNPDCTDPECKGECKVAGETKACCPTACPEMK